MIKSLILSLFFLFLLFFPKPVFAGTLSNVSDTITTSRPSSSASLASDQPTNSTQATIIDNGSIFLASDSGTLIGDQGEVYNAVTISSISPQNTPSQNQRIVYFAQSAPNSHHKGDSLTVPIKAMHTIKFTTATVIPSGGKIIISFQGGANTSASPSASTFAFNGLSEPVVKVNNANCSFTVQSPSITCTLSSQVLQNTTITIFLGCSAQTAGFCNIQAPTLINPTKTGVIGISDIWSVSLTTQDTTGNIIDTADTRVGIIESVQLKAVIPPSLTFTISGINNNAPINSGNTKGCTNTESTNTGLSSTATTLNLGSLSTGSINISAQLLTVTTNSQNGYVLSATSSGHLTNLSSGAWLSDSTTPQSMTSGTTWFGIHPCGLDTDQSLWGSGQTGGGAGAKYSWPTKTGNITLASRSNGPISSSLIEGEGLVSVEYAATIDSSVPAGVYSSTITYSATPTF